jgi:hypothetical protein
LDSNDPTIDHADPEHWEFSKVSGFLNKYRKQMLSEMHNYPFVDVYENTEEAEAKHKEIQRLVVRKWDANTFFKHMNNATIIVVVGVYEEGKTTNHRLRDELSSIHGGTIQCGLVEMSVVYAYMK